MLARAAFIQFLVFQIREFAAAAATEHRFTLTWWYGLKCMCFQFIVALEAGIKLLAQSTFISHDVNGGMPVLAASLLV